MDLTAHLTRDLAANLVRPDQAQVSHGLNLMLRLRDDVDLRMLLLQIHIEQRRTRERLGELNFVHFARFLPSHDLKALQVITEFDGPLAPYVLDFAIEIGPLFDMLLRHTRDTEFIVPIAEHPTEFLAFVEKHNTVNVPQMDSVADWPLYAAYPERTVLDIVGARDDLPIPKADRWLTPVAREDVQCNVLRGFRGERVRHFLLSVVHGTKARAWLAGRATPDNGAAAGVPRITSFTRWTNKPAVALNIGLTPAGMASLGIRASWLALFPKAFVEGALARAEANFDTGANAPAHWWLGGPDQAGRIHVVVSLYQARGADEAFRAAAEALAASLVDGGLEAIATHDAWHNEGRSWFGYADGIAQPRVAGAPPDHGRDSDLQPAATAGEFVLGAKYKNIYGGTSLGRLPEVLATNGTFCAVRVLEQRVGEFHRTLEVEAARLNRHPAWLAAKLMGRWPDGAPLGEHPDHSPSDPAEHSRNDFDYAPSYEYPNTLQDHDGRRCPVGAHIRRANPRTSRIAGARYTRRLMRRGMHYDITDDEGRREVGLFGLFICADLERQFEFIQREWINGDRFVSGLVGTRDPFVGTPQQGRPHEFEIPMANEPALRIRLEPFVRTRGSLYLFMPGLKALRELECFATTEAPSRARASVPTSTHTSANMPPPGRGTARATARLLSDDELLAIAYAAVGDRPTPAVGVKAMQLRFDPRRRDFQANPYPVYAEFRRNEPVHYSPLYGGWFVFRYDDVVAVCDDNDRFSGAALDGVEARGLFTLDDPEHAQVRALVELAWRGAAVGMPQLVENSITQTLAALHGREHFDLVDDFARGVPRAVYFDILGGPGIVAGEREVMDALARTVMKYRDKLLDREQRIPGYLAAKELLRYLEAMLHEAGGSSSRFEGSFLAHLAPLIGDHHALNWRVAMATLLSLTVAGYMSVEFLLATGVRRLLLDREHLWNRVAQPGFLPKALEEMRRTAHALSVVDRFARSELQIGGVTIPKGKPVFGVLASANRDERVFGLSADRFDPERPWPRPHLGLGHGVHDCMGRPFEPLISTPAITALHAAIPSLRLQSSAEPPWFQNFYFRSFDHLAVTSS